MFERALAIQQIVYGPDHPLVVESMYNLGVSLEKLGDDLGAKTYYDQAAGILEKGRLQTPTPATPPTGPQVVPQPPVSPGPVVVPPAPAKTEPKSAPSTTPPATTKAMPTPAPSATPPAATSKPAPAPVPPKPQPTPKAPEKELNK
jgi:hypothetical protein